MNEDDMDARLREIVDRFGPPRQWGLLGGTLALPLDTSKPNIHDSKAAFIEEKRAVEASLEEGDALLDFLMAAYRPEVAEHALSERIVEIINGSVRKRAQHDRPETIARMIRKNAADAGLCYCLIYLLIDLVEELKQRKQELENQEAIFWNVNGRAPNHYARAIALRLARAVAHRSGKMPTFGTSSDGGHPSTEFGRALEEVFEILEIKADVRHPAKWAISQLSEDDLKPEPINHLAAGSFFGQPSALNALSGITDAIAKSTKP